MSGEGLSENLAASCVLGVAYGLPVGEEEDGAVDTEATGGGGGGGGGIDEG